jgi:hypothetical protein
MLMYTYADVCCRIRIRRQHTSERGLTYADVYVYVYISIRQHTSERGLGIMHHCILLAYRRAHTSSRPHAHGSMPPNTSAYVRIRPHSSAYVSIRQHTSAYVSICQHTSAYVSIRQHTSAYVSIRQHTSAYVSNAY